MSGHWRRMLAALAAALVVGLLFSSLALGKGKPPDDPPPTPPDPVYYFEDLGVLGGEEHGSSGAQAINAYGEVVGTSATDTGASHAYVWTDGLMTGLGTLGGPTSAAEDINDAGWIVGYSDTAGGQETGFVVAGSVMLPLDIPPVEGADIVGTRGFGINNAGQVGGDAVVYPYWGSTAAFWQLDASGVPLEALLWLDLAVVGWEDINDSGVMGGSDVLGGMFKPIIGWLDPDGDLVLTRLIPPDWIAIGEVLSINASGWAVGYVDWSATHSGPFLFMPAGDVWHVDADGDGANDLMTPLPTWGTPTRKRTGMWYPQGINDWGQIVGTSSEDGLALLCEDGVVYDLNGLVAPAGGTLVSANDINNAGQIVGEIAYEYQVGPRPKDVATYTHGYRLTPIP